MKDLLLQILPKLKRFGTIYYINDFHAVYTCNYNTVISQMHSLSLDFQKEDSKALENMIDLMAGIENPDFLKQLANSLLLKVVSSMSVISTYELTEWLVQINQETDLTTLRNLITEKMKTLLSDRHKDAHLSSMTLQIYDYVNQNLHNSDLTLKYIAENHLFMNVDYVSKKFYKETGQKFSQFITALRIQKAKELIVNREYHTIQEIADKIGYGNNPQYFSQLFKKITGITPTGFIAKINNSHDI